MLTYVPASQQQKTARNLDIDPGANYVVHSSFVDISRFCSDGGFDCRTRGLVLLPGEEVVFSGYNYDSDSPYLFITGPDISPGGENLLHLIKKQSAGIPVHSK